MSTNRISLPSPPESREATSPVIKYDTPQTYSLDHDTTDPDTKFPRPDEIAKLDPAQARSRTTGQFLENIAEQVIDISLNLKDLNHPILKRHMSPDFRGKHDALPTVSNRADHTSALQAHLDKQPDFKVAVLNSSSEVDDSRGRATVYVWYEITGLENGLRRENVAVFTWERKQGLWMIIKHTGMRGPSGFS